jgi:GT2 family glycosyltransferase
MDKLIIAAPAINNLKYTKLFIESICSSYPYEVLIIDNASIDGTPQWLKDNEINFIRYEENRGFSYAYNDALDYAFKDRDTFLLFCGNDIVFMPHTIDHLVKALFESDYDMLCGNEILNKEILIENKEALNEFFYKCSFKEEKYDDLTYSLGGMNHSCLIRKRSVFERVGYYDVNFYPAYFEDNDFARRCDLLGIKYGTVDSASFYHFWSRSIYEGGIKELNSQRFPLNRDYYVNKWGGSVGNDSHTSPFNSGSDVRISIRGDELQILKGFGVI